MRRDSIYKSAAKAKVKTGPGAGSLWFSPWEDPACKGCIYYSDGRTSIKTCNFLSMTGHARIKICGPGKDCTVKVTKKEN